MLKHLIKFEVSATEYILISVQAESKSICLNGLEKFMTIGLRYAGKENVRGVATWFVRYAKTAIICTSQTKVTDYDSYLYVSYDYDDGYYRCGEVK